MNHKHSAIPLIFILALISVTGFFVPVSCTDSGKGDKPRTDTPVIQKPSVNILFKPGTDKSTRDRIIKNIKQIEIDAYALISSDPLKFDEASCPCDTLLYNLSFAPLGGAGSSIIKPASTRPGVVPGGDRLSIEGIANDLEMTDEFVKDSADSQNRGDKMKAIVKEIKTDSSKILAIIDSGLDPALFSSPISNLIWTDNPATATLSNFIPGQFNTGSLDLTRVSHGSAVAAVAIKAMENISRYPKLMILKALDNEDKGSIFSVSCALSYAIQKKATLINLSLGYYDKKPDSILYHYLGLCSSAKPVIEVFAAAGNTPGPHPGPLCASPTPGSLPTARGFFYPACFTPDFRNITSVTQLSEKNTACFYQNYSDKFIQLGVLKSANCCSMPVGFTSNPQYYEGSSFATPAASGLRMATIIDNTDWNSLIRSSGASAPKVTIDGKYIEYSP